MTSQEVDSYELDAPPRYEHSSSTREDLHETFERGGALGFANEFSDEDAGPRLDYKAFAGPKLASRTRWTGRKEGLGENREVRHDRAGSGPRSQA